MSLFEEIKKIAKDVLSEVHPNLGDTEKFLDSVFAKIGFSPQEVINDIRDALLNELAEAINDLDEIPVGNFDLHIEVAKIFLFVEHIVYTTQGIPGTLIDSIKAAVKSGDLEKISNVLAPAAVTFTSSMRRDARRTGKPVPDEILNLLPDHENALIRGADVLYTTVDFLEDKSFFWIWRHFNGKRTAICLGEVIIYESEPEITTLEGQFTFVHELKHVLQYLELGFEDYIREYVHEEILKRPDIHPFEREADEFACSILPAGNPAYIGTCPIPEPPK